MSGRLVLYLRPASASLPLAGPAHRHRKHGKQGQNHGVGDRREATHRFVRRHPDDGVIRLDITVGERDLCPVAKRRGGARFHGTMAPGTTMWIGPNFIGSSPTTSAA
jgi:hypothetical protein